ncbi:MAG: nitroreductase family protein [Lachnospira sp.]|nr:nitroreductase family protein [Lachnospira sp.]
MNAIDERRSIRKYKSGEIDRQDIEKIVIAGTLAPSAKNRQPWKYIVYTDGSKQELLNVMERGLIRERDASRLLPESHNCLSDAFNTLRIMREAPVLIIIENTNGTSPYKQIDSERRVSEICDTLSIGASVENMLLKATELGYGTLWIANTCFAYDELIEFTEIKGQLVGAVSLGIADEMPAKRPRKPLEEVLEFRE